MPIAGDLITNVIATFAADGLRRGYQEVTSLARRRHALDKAISGSPPAPDPRLKKAIDDLQIMIGNAKGELTEPVAAFLREIERSAIPEALIKSILANADQKLIYSSFQSIHESFSGLKFPPDKFFDAFYTAVRFRVEENVKDPGLLEFIQAQNKELSKQLDGLIRSLGEAAKVKSPLAAKDINEARIKLARSIEVANRYVAVETLQGAKRCRIKQLVVPPRLATIVGGPDIKKSRANLNLEAHTGYIQFKTTFRRAVILGDPGGGKSTLTQLLCFDNSNSIVLESSFPGKPQIDPTELRVPFRIILRSFDKLRQTSPGYGFFDYLTDQIREVFDNDSEYSRKVLRHLLGFGNAILIFDGLDEILEVETRREIVALIERFSNLYTGCPAVVTSRFVGYRDAPMSEDFSIYHLATFNNGEVEAFAQKFIKFVAGIKVSEAKDRAEKFLKQTNNIGNDLRENPLMLGLMVYLYIYRGDVPSNRPEIYKECATLMFEKWDQRRDIIFKIPVDFDLLDLYSFLASKIFGSAQTEDGVSREWLLNEARKFFEDWYLDKAKALHSARSLVDFITGRAWVMYEVGPNVFKFTHRTFLEYFFARHLLSFSESISGLIKSQLLPKIVRSEWDVIGHLALQTAVFRDAGKMNQAADTISDIIRQSRATPKQDLAFLSFVSGALEYLLLPEMKYRNLVKMICSSLITIGGKSDPSAIAVLNSLIRYTRKREGLAKGAIYEVLREKLNSSDAGDRLFSLFAIAKRPRSVSQQPYRLTLATDNCAIARSNGNYFFELRQELRHINVERALRDKDEARLFVFSYSQSYLELFKRHGVDVFFQGDGGIVVRELPNIMLEIIYEVLSEMEVKRGAVPASNAERSEEGWALIEEISRWVDQQGGIDAARGAFGKVKTDGKLADEIVRSIYFLALRRGATLKERDRAVRALVVLGLTLGDPSRTRSGRQKHRRRLLQFMPAQAMTFLLRSLESQPLYRLFDSWNGVEHSSVVP